MKIQIAAYDPGRERDFETLREELERLTGFLRPRIEHIDSTSVEGLSAKPVIDILVGTETEDDLDRTLAPLTGKGYVSYEKNNDDMPYRRFFVRLKQPPGSLLLPGIIRKGDTVPERLNDHSLRLAHIHVIPESSVHWKRHIAFRGYLRARPDEKDRYQKLKEALGTRERADGNAYNGAKDDFLKTEKRNAPAWYMEQNEPHP